MAYKTKETIADDYVEASSAGAVPDANVYSDSDKQTVSLLNILSASAGDSLFFDGTKFVPLRPYGSRGVFVSNDGFADYTSIADAVNAAAAMSPADGSEVVVFVAPGSYVEPPFTVPSYVHIVSQSGIVSSVDVSPTTRTSDFITLESNSIIMGLSLHGVDQGYSLVVVNGVSLALFDCMFRDCGTAVSASSSDPLNPAFAFLVNCAGIINQPNARIDKVVHADGPYAAIDISGFITSVAPQLLSLYAPDDPVTRVLVAENSGSIFANAGSYSIFSNSGNTIIAEALSGGRITLSSVTIHSADTVARSFGAGSVVTMVGPNIFSASSVAKADSVDSRILATGGSITDTSLVSGPGLVVINSYDITRSSYVSYGEIDVTFADGESASMSDLTTGGRGTGVITGGECTRQTSPTSISVAAGRGLIVDGSQAKATSVSWDATSITPLNGLGYVVVDKTGAVSTVSSKPASTEKLTLCEYFYESSSDTLVVADSRIVERTVAANLDRYLTSVVMPIVESGMTISPTGDGTFIDVSSGVIWRGFRPIQIVNPAYFVSVYGGSMSNASAVTAADTTNYDTGAGLGAMTSGYYRADSVYALSDGGILIVYGTAEYPDQVSAENHPMDPAPPEVVAFSVPLGLMIVQQGGSVVSVKDYRRFHGSSAASAGSGATDHGNLTGLLDDDHPQYLLVDGTRQMAGPLDMGGFSIINVSTINGVDVASHGSRHAPGGPDAIPTGSSTDIQPVGTTASAGTSGKFADAGHVHPHGNLGGGSLHAEATPSAAGFMSAADKAKLDTVEPNAKDDQAATEVPYTSSFTYPFQANPTNVGEALDELSKGLEAVGTSGLTVIGTSGQVTFTSSATIPFDTTVSSEPIPYGGAVASVNPSTFAITINNDGIYLIAASVSFSMTSGNNREVVSTFFEYVSPQTTFGAPGKTYLRNNSSGLGNTLSLALVSMTGATSFTVKTQQLLGTGNTIQTVPSDTYLFIVPIGMGWIYGAV